LEALASGLQNCTALESFNLSGNYLSARGTAILADNFPPCLKHFDASRTHLDNAKLSMLSQALKCSTPLTHLDLSQ
jgi:hypothetical protein